MADHPIDTTAVCASLSTRSAELCDRLDSLGAEALTSPSLLPEWSVLTIACHLRYGAQALRQITGATLVGAPSAYYPAGRDVQRPFTLQPALGEPAAHVLESLRYEAAELDELWGQLGDDDWGRSMVPHPGDDDTLGSMSLRDLLLLRLTEVMVHGSDLGLGLPRWPLTFGQAVLPLRIERARVRHPDGFEAVVEFAASDAETRRVRFTGDTALATDEDPDLTVSAVANDLVALLLGRQPLGGVTVSGDAELVVRFRDGVIGP